MTSLLLKNSHWAMTEDALAKMVELEAKGLSANRPQVKKVAKRMGPVAVIDVSGPLFKQENLLTQLFGGSSYEGIEHQLYAAMQSDAKAIVLNIDSPGGEISGCGELAKVIHDAKAVKPVLAYASGQCASAAYWLASACESIVASETALIGSIGVVGVVGKETEEKDITFVSTQSPNKRPNPESDAGKKQIVGQLDDLCSVFISEVAKGRGVTAEVVKETYGKGATMIGEKALKAGLVDKLGTFNQLIGGVMAHENENGAAAPQAELEERPAVGAQSEGFMEERQRILGILDLKGSEELTHKMISEGRSIGDSAIAFRKEEMARRASTPIQFTEDSSVKNLANVATDDADEVDPLAIVAFASNMGV